MLSCLGRTPPHTCGAAYMWMENRGGARSPISPTVNHFSTDGSVLTSRLNNSGLRDSIPIEPRYATHILKLSAISEPPALISVMPHFIPPSTSSQSTAPCHHISVFLCLMDPFLDFPNLSKTVSKDNKPKQTRQSL